MVINDTVIFVDASSFDLAGDICTFAICDAKNILAPQLISKLGSACLEPRMRNHHPFHYQSFQVIIIHIVKFRRLRRRPSSISPLLTPTRFFSIKLLTNRNIRFRSGCNLVPRKLGLNRRIFIWFNHNVNIGLLNSTQIMPRSDLQHIFLNLIKNSRHIVIRCRNNHGLSTLLVT